MKRPIFSIFILSLMVSFCGCFPYHFTEKPGVSGIVVDAYTGVPIQEANIRLVSYPFPLNEQRVEMTTTLKDGSFVIPAEQRWSLYMVPLDPGPVRGIVSVQADGYKEYVREFHLNTMGPATTKMKSIKMEHLP